MVINQTTDALIPHTFPVYDECDARGGGLNQPLWYTLRPSAYGVYIVVFTHLPSDDELLNSDGIACVHVDFFADTLKAQLWDAEAAAHNTDPSRNITLVEHVTSVITSDPQSPYQQEKRA